MYRRPEICLPYHPNPPEYRRTTPAGASRLPLEHLTPMVHPRTPRL